MPVIGAPAGVSAPVKMRAYQATALVVAANSIVKYGTVEQDTTGSYSTSTGLFTVPYTGTYLILAGVKDNSTSSSQVVFNIQRNGVATYWTSNGFGASYAGSRIAVSMDLAAGDTIGVLCGGGITTMVESVGQGGNFFQVQLLAQTTTTVGTSVSVEAYVTPGSTLPVGTVIFQNKTIDTNNAYSVTTGLFTAPTAGVYLINFYCRPLSTNNASPQFSIQKNGTDFVVGGVAPTASPVGIAQPLLIQLAVGDTLSVKSGTAVQIETYSVPSTYMSIQLVAGGIANTAVANQAGTIAIRDVNGRTQVSNPSAANDVANKSYVDTTVAAASGTVQYGVGGVSASNQLGQGSYNITNTINVPAFAYATLVTVRIQCLISAQTGGPDTVSLAPTFTGISPTQYSRIFVNSPTATAYLPLQIVMDIVVPANTAWSVAGTVAKQTGNGTTTFSGGSDTSLTYLVVTVRRA